MNSSLNAISVTFAYPWLLLLLIPAAALMLFPYLRLPKRRRRTRNRIISLVLHGLIMVLCVLMVSGMSFHATEVSKKTDVILLVDLSDSNRSSEEDMNAFIRGLLASKEENYKVGIVTFANGTVFSAEIRSNADSVYEDYLTNDVKPLGNATDIASAFDYARSALATPRNGRVILLSDGLETDGNAIAAVKAMADEGIRVDTVYFPPKNAKGEVQILSVDVPERVSLGDEIKVTVSLLSGAATSAHLKLFDNGEEVAGRDVTLSGTEEAFSFDYEVTTSGLHSFYVTLDASGDSLSQNNEYYSYLNIEMSTKVLLVDGTGEESAALQDILEENYEVTRVTTSELPTSLEALCAFDEVILMNVANSALPQGFDGILYDYVQDYGGGLYTIGGDMAYKKEDMSGTLYESLLPIESDSSSKSLGLLLVIDKSSSMNQNAQGTAIQRMQLAKDAAIASLNVLRAGDYIGVIAFDAEAARITNGMLPVSISRESVKAAIQDIKTGRGTGYLPATDEAMNCLMSFDKTDLRHIIFLTDGEPTDNNLDWNPDPTKDDRIATCKEYIRRMSQNGITLSTIALGPSVSANTLTTVREMAEVYGSGRFYNVAQESSLIEIMTKEAQIATGEYSNEVHFAPRIKSRTPAVAGLTSLPSLNGFYGAKLKTGAVEILSFGDSPIYAEWSCGKGKVASFMSDLSGRWSSEFLSADAGRRFLRNSVGAIFPEVRDHSFDAVRVSFNKDNFTSQVRLSLDRTVEDLAATLILPDGSRETLTLSRASDYLYVSEFATKQSGVYAVDVTYTEAGTEQSITAYTDFSYSAEYDVFHDEAECFSFMEALSENGKGKMLFSSDGVFGVQNEMTEETIDPRLVLLIVAAVLFLLDIVVRKFKIKLPREIREERRGKKEGVS